jgi:hypothetical protein
MALTPKGDTVTNREKALEEALRAIEHKHFYCVKCGKHGDVDNVGFSAVQDPRTQEWDLTCCGDTFNITDQPDEIAEAALSLPATSTKTPEGWLNRSRLVDLRLKNADKPGRLRAMESGEIAALVRMALYAMEHQAHGEGHGKPAVCPECGGDGRQKVFDCIKHPEDAGKVIGQPYDCPACNGSGKQGER